MGSLNEPRCSIRLRLTLATLQFRCIFTHSWSGGRLHVAKMVLWLCGPTDGNRSPKREATSPYARPVEARRSSGAVTRQFHFRLDIIWSYHPCSSIAQLGSNRVALSTAHRCHLTKGCSGRCTRGHVYPGSLRDL
jgi:hypothetical protein